jgi:hypothetical protein
VRKICGASGNRLFLSFLILEGHCVIVGLAGGNSCYITIFEHWFVKDMLQSAGKRRQKFLWGFPMKRSHGKSVVDTVPNL